MANPNAPGFFKEAGSSGSSTGSSGTDVHVTSGAISGQNLVLSLSDATTVTIPLSSVFSDNRIESAAYNSTSNTLTITQGGRSVTVTIPRTAGAQGPAGPQGESVFIYYADDANGANAGTIPGNKEFIRFVVAQNQPANPPTGTGTYHNYVGPQGPTGAQGERLSLIHI